MSNAVGDGERRRGVDSFTLATLAVLAIDLVFGGATEPDAVSSLVARLVSLPLFFSALWRLRAVRLGWEGRLGLWIMAAIIAVPLLQSASLPPSIWEQLPGRQSLVADYAAAGIPAPWLPISLAPYETQDVLAWLVPCCTMFLAGLGLRARGALIVFLTIPVIGVIAVGLGLMQVLDGAESALRFYNSTNLDSAVGFFANRNHQAALLVVGLAIAPLWMGVFGQGSTGAARLGVAVAVLLQVLLVVGIGVTGSRAGVLIGIPVLAIAALISATCAPDRFSRRTGLCLLVAALSGATLFGLFARTALVERFHAPIGDELRLQTAPLVIRAAKTFFPFGSGLGSFESVFQEVEPLRTVTPFAFNHAHDDAMELLVETGAFGMALLGIFAIWWTGVTARLVAFGRMKNGLGIFASLAVAALIAHSLVDYPLRTTALASLFALGAGVMASSASERQAAIARKSR